MEYINVPENLEELRKKEYAEEYNVLLVQNDSLDEFVSIYNEQDLVPYQMIEPSIFETNAFLCKN